MKKNQKKKPVWLSTTSCKCLFLFLFDAATKNIVQKNLWLKRVVSRNVTATKRISKEPVCKQDIDLQCINLADTECHSSARNKGGCLWSHTGAFSPPTHRVISVSKPWSHLHGWSLIGSRGFWDKADDSFLFFFCFFCFDSMRSKLSHKKKKKTLQRCCLTTISSLAPEDSSRCTREWQNVKKTVSVLIFIWLLHLFLFLYLFYCQHSPSSHVWLNLQLKQGFFLFKKKSTTKTFSSWKKKNGSSLISLSFSSPDSQKTFVQCHSFFISSCSHNTRCQLQVLFLIMWFDTINLFSLHSPQVYLNEQIV